MLTSYKAIKPQSQPCKSGFNCLQNDAAMGAEMGAAMILTNDLAEKTHSLVTASRIWSITPEVLKEAHFIWKEKFL